MLLNFTDFKHSHNEARDKKSDISIKKGLVSSNMILL